ncbi:MAG TPA: hypothetical protein VJN95_03280 [Gemmatimonadales bacterium]|nr:hypothetical protein [Gemmatimonadales bacterium]
MVVLLALTACSDTSGPRATNPPYIAIITKVTAGPANQVGQAYRYRIRELSGTINIDTTLTVAPRDTVILPVKPATYVISLEGVPAQCRIREGADQAVQVAEGINTAIVRYLVSCQPQLMLTTATDGFRSDSFFVWHIQAADGVEQTGLIHGNDTVEINGLPHGKATVDLAQLSDGCEVTSDGGDHPTVTLDAEGGASHEFRVICSDPVLRPRLLDVTATYHDRTAGILFHLFDPNGDPDRYFFNLTDCQRNGLLPTGVRFRRGLDAGSTAGRDTVSAFATFEVGIPDDSLAGKCALVYVADYDGNLSTLVETPLAHPRGRPPAVSRLDARFNGTQALLVQVNAGDPDNDLLGVFGAAILRDGTIGAPDNHSDIGAYNGIGYPGLALPSLSLGGSNLSYENFLGVIVYVFDQAGNFTRVEDDDLFQ